MIASIQREKKRESGARFNTQKKREQEQWKIGRKRMRTYVNRNECVFIFARDKETFDGRKGAREKEKASKTPFAYCRELVSG